MGSRALLRVICIPRISFLEMLLGVVYKLVRFENLLTDLKNFLLKFAS
jgi:hypothetical protein